MNIIFLDIDGVLLPDGSYNWDVSKVLAKPYNYLDRLIERTPKNIVEALRGYSLSTQAEFVLISTWRHLFSDDFLHDYFVGIGLRDCFHPDWIARDGEGLYRQSKKQDIARWLALHPESEADVISGNKWTIIDDEDQGVPEENWIKTDPKIGFRYDTERT